MALIGKISIAMGVDTRKLGAGLKGAAGQLVAFGAKIEQTGGALKALLAGAAAYKAAEGIRSMVSSASDLNENMSKVQAIFGAGARTVVAASDEMAAAFGTSKNEFLDATGKLGGLFKGAGYSADEAAKLSVQFTKLSADASSFFNLSFDEAFMKIRSGLSGESEPLKDLGILMNEDMVKAQAMAMGLGKAGQELSNQAKVQARAAIIARGLADAQGDLAKTADGVANATRGLQGRIENLAGAMGSALQPIAQAVLGEMSTAVGALSIAWEENRASVINWGMSAIGSVGETAQSMGVLQRAIGFVADAWDVLRMGFAAVQSYVTAGIAAIADAIRRMLESVFSAADAMTGALRSAGIGMLDGWANIVDMWTGKTADLRSTIVGDLDAIGKDLRRLSDDQWAGFQKKLAQPWPSQAINDYFDKAEARTKALRDGMARTPAASAAAAATAPAAAKHARTGFASAMEAGSRESVNAVLRSRYGAGLSRGPAEQTAKNTAKANELLGKVVSQLNRNEGRARPAFGHF